MKSWTIRAKIPFVGTNLAPPGMFCSIFELNGDGTSGRHVCTVNSIEDANLMASAPKMQQALKNIDELLNKRILDEQGKAIKEIIKEALAGMATNENENR